jgi:hypothetical protein
MPLKNPPGAGTNSDGTLNSEYCAYCYSSGKFTQPNITALEMQMFVKNKLKELRFPSFLAWLFSRGIPNLKRWKNK